MTYDREDDPARDAMRTPERPDLDDPIHVVGIGPGNLAYLPQVARDQLAQADVVLGFESVIGLVESEIDGALMACTYDDETDMLSRFADEVNKGAYGVVAVMGDPNVSGYQFIGKVQRAVDRPLRIVPGISSVQVAASRARTPVEESTVVTLHKSGPIESDLEVLSNHVGNRHLLVLPRPFDWMPDDIARHLVESGAQKTLEAIVYEGLTHEHERHDRCQLGELASTDYTYSDMSILVIKKAVA